MRSGCVAANRVQSGPPSNSPNNAACSDPTASMTALRSSSSTSGGGAAARGTESDSPIPRRSTMISRENEASDLRNLASRGCCQDTSSREYQPGTYTRSTGPAPATL